jgi:hypothetical protein
VGMSVCNVFIMCILGAAIRYVGMSVYRVFIMCILGAAIRFDNHFLLPCFFSDFQAYSIST